MNQAFAASYSDGKSLEVYAAQVWLEPGQIRIDYQTPKQPVPVRVYWQPARIRLEIYPERSAIILRYGQEPTQRLEIISTHFYKLFEEQYLRKPLANEPVQQVVKANKPWAWLGLGAASVISLLASFYLWGIPLLADRAAQAMPVATEVYIGQQLFSRNLAQAQEDKKLSYLVQGFYRQLRVKSAYTMHIAVVRDRGANAFALPGGYLVIHNSILTRLQYPEELAALLGHETGHVQQRHTTRALFRALSTYLFLSLILNDLSGIAAVALQNADVLKHLEYSRKLEHEADVYSFHLLRQNQIPARGLLLLLEHLKENKNNRNSELEFLSTHPALHSRLQEMKQLIRSQPYTVHPNDSLNYYWQQIKIVRQNSKL